MYTFEIFTVYKDALLERVAEANRKLQKIGLPNVEYTVTYDRTDEDERSISVVTIDEIMPYFDGHKFIALVEYVNEVAIVRSVPGEVCPTEFFITPDPTRCDHCHVKHNRVRSFVLCKMETAEYMQVGAACLEKYMPRSAAKLIKAAWLIDFIAELEDEFGADEEDSYFSIRNNNTYDIKHVLSLTLRSMANRGWVSGSKARDEGIMSTADHVRWLFGKQSSERERWFNENPKKSHYNVGDILTFCQDMRPTNEYSSNIRNLAHMSYISWRDFGFVCSMPSAYIRETEKVEKPAEVKVLPQAGKQTVKGQIISFKETYGDFGVTVKVLLQCEGYRLFVSLPKAAAQAEVGDTLEITNCIVTPKEEGFAFGKLNSASRGKIIK